MSMTDPIADMLTRIRNACGSKHRRVDMPVSKVKTEIARILKENNFIQDYRVLETDNGRPVLRVVLKYAQGGQPVIRELKRVSSPGSGMSASAKSRACGTASAWRSSARRAGLMSDAQARRSNTGGELLALVW
jgi:small subunit ribosomal protein S8